MTAILPMQFEWTGSVMAPLNRRAAERMYQPGEQYRLEHREDRSAATHNHEFAWLHEAWLNLPESIADQYPTPESLRKRALIEAGFYDQEVIDVGNKAGALRVAASLRKIDDFALVIVRGPLVVRRVAKSQSRRSMNKAEFQASKTKIMEVIADLIGVPPEHLGRAA
jgi:hypothetical protein